MKNKFLKFLIQTQRESKVPKGKNKNLIDKQTNKQTLANV